MSVLSAKNEKNLLLHNTTKQPISKHFISCTDNNNYATLFSNIDISKNYNHFHYLRTNK